jgi:cytidyltransferase-like protein
MSVPLHMDWTAEEQERWLSLGQKIHVVQQPIVLVSGVFDLFHEEHKRFLEKAALLAPQLVVGIESDARVRQMKGEGRPHQSQDTRLQQIQECGVPLFAAILPESFSQPEHHRALLDILKPNFLAVSENSPHQENKRRMMESIGGELRVVHEHNPAISTTQLLAQQASSKVQ